MSGHSLNCPVITSAAGGPCTCGTINAMDVRSYTVAAPPAPEASSEKDAQTAQMIAELSERLECARGALQIIASGKAGADAPQIAQAGLDLLAHGVDECAKARGEAL